MNIMIRPDHSTTTKENAYVDLIRTAIDPMGFTIPTIFRTTTQIRLGCYKTNAVVTEKTSRVEPICVVMIANGIADKASMTRRPSMEVMSKELGAIPAGTVTAWTTEL